MAKIYKSEAMAATHEMMEGFHQTGAIDKQTMREFDEACLIPGLNEFDSSSAHPRGSA